MCVECCRCCLDGGTIMNTAAAVVPRIILHKTTPRVHS